MLSDKTLAVLKSAGWVSHMAVPGGNKLVSQMADVCVSLSEYARSMIRQKRDGIGCLCAFCGSEHVDEKKIEHEADCPLVKLNALEEAANNAK